MKNIIKVLMCFIFLICVVCFMAIGVGSNSNVTDFSRPTEIETTEREAIDLEFIEVEPETTEATEPITEPTVAVPEPTEPEPVFELSDYERWVACCMVAGEAGGEPYDGKWAVAQCIYQACVREGVTPSQVRVAYQYSGWNESIQYNHPELWAEIEEASQITDSSFKQLLGRLRNTYRGKNWMDFRYRLFGHTNPQADKGWIWHRFVEQKKEKIIPIYLNYSQSDS